jgi:thioredoxin 1
LHLIGEIMATIELTAENFAEVVATHDIVLVDFWAEWCGPCRRFGPVFEEAARQHPDVVFGKVDTEAQPELAGAFQIMSIPTLMAFRDQVIVYADAGALPGSALEDLIGQVEALDMESVRQEIAGQQAVAGAEASAPSD